MFKLLVYIKDLFKYKSFLKHWGPAVTLNSSIHVNSTQFFLVMYLTTQVQSKVVWNSMNSTIKGYAMSPDELPWLHDVFMGIGEDFDQQKTSYTHSSFYGGT